MYPLTVLPAWVVTFLIVASASMPNTAYAEPLTSSNRNSGQILVDENILSVFMSEPCRHFEQSREKFLGNDFRASAAEIRVAIAFLKLEASRSISFSKPLLTSAIQALERVAEKIEMGKVAAVTVLDDAFAQAHYALAGHHCLLCSHACCNPVSSAKSLTDQHMSCDLKAAAYHFDQGMHWGNASSEAEDLKAIRDALQFGNRLGLENNGVKGDFSAITDALRMRIRKVTGFRIEVAPSPYRADPLVPPISK